MAEAVKPWEAYQKKVEGPWTQYQSEPGPAKTDTERLVENAPDSFIRAGENIVGGVRDFGKIALQGFKMSPFGGMLKDKDFAGEKETTEATGDAMSKLALVLGKSSLGPLARPLTKHDFIGENAVGDAVKGAIKNRYGSLDAAKETAITDPAGVLMDLSTVLTGGGTAAATLPGKLGKAGQAVKTAGLAVDPVNAIAKTGKAAVMGASKMIPHRVPNEMFQKAVKFSTTTSSADRQKMAETALKHKIMPTQKGVDTIRSKMSSLDSEITKLINDATASGKTIPKDAIYRHLKALRRDAGGVKIEGGRDLKQIDAVAKRFDEHMKSLGKDSVTPDELQAFKRDVYEQANMDVENLRAESGTNHARREIARAAKESIEQVAPVKDLNRQYGDLIELLEPLERSTNRISNNNMVGINAPLHILAGSQAGPGGAAVGTMLSVLEHPKPRAWIALQVRKMQESGLSELAIKRAMPTIMRQAAYQFGRESELREPVE